MSFMPFTISDAMSYIITMLEIKLKYAECQFKLQLIIASMPIINK